MALIIKLKHKVAVKLETVGSPDIEAKEMDRIDLNG